MSHGDLYGHNIMCSQDGTALLGDFGAATIYCSCVADDESSVVGCSSEISEQLQRIEVRALGILILELLSIVKDRSGCNVMERMTIIANSCISESCNERPLFAAVDEDLKRLIAEFV